MAVPMSLPWLLSGTVGRGVGCVAVVVALGAVGSVVVLTVAVVLAAVAVVFAEAVSVVAAEAVVTVAAPSPVPRVIPVMVGSSVPQPHSTVASAAAHKKTVNNCFIFFTSVLCYQKDIR